MLELHKRVFLPVLGFGAARFLEAGFGAVAVPPLLEAAAASALILAQTWVRDLVVRPGMLISDNLTALSPASWWIICKRKVY